MAQRPGTSWLPSLLGEACGPGSVSPQGHWEVLRALGGGDVKAGRPLSGPT